MPKPKPSRPRSASASDLAIGKRIRQRRNEQKLSQAELGEHLGVTFQQVQKYEKGVNRLSAGRLVAIAKALDCEIGFFLPSTDRRKADSAVDHVMATKDGVMIAKALVRIGDDTIRHAIARFIDGISHGGAGVMQAAE